MTFKDLSGTLQWAFLLTLLLVLVGFFPVAVLLWVGAALVATLWRVAQ